MKEKSAKGRERRHIKRAPLRGHDVVPALWTVFTNSGGGSELDQPGIPSGFNLDTDEIHGGAAMSRFRIERDISSGEDSLAANLGAQ